MPDTPNDDGWFLTPAGQPLYGDGHGGSTVYGLGLWPTDDRCRQAMSALEQLARDGLKARHRADHEADMLAIVAALADIDPRAFDTARGHGTRCALCDTDAPGGALDLTPGQHDPGCPWRRARELADTLAEDVRRAAAG